jgi:hypothetical protein
VIVFTAFARAGCAAVRNNEWTGEQLRVGAMDFRNSLIWYVYDEKEVPQHSDWAVLDLIDWSKTFRRLVIESPTFVRAWRRYLKDMHEAALGSAALQQQAARISSVSAAAAPHNLQERCTALEETPTAAEPQAISEISRRSPRSHFPKRAAWLESMLAKVPGLTEGDFRKCGGPDRQTTKRILEGKPVRKRSLAKVIPGLRHCKIPISPADIPND